MKAKILEIFRSVQGEGKYVGAPQVFVRLFECNMHCVWCDTPHSIGDGRRDYKEMTLDEVLAEVNRLDDNAHSVSITGGEPLLQKDFVKSLGHALKQEGKTIYLDTNGTLPEALKETIEDIDIVAMDLKLPSSTKERPFWTEHEAFLKIARGKEIFIKAVVSLDTDPKEIFKAAKLVAAVDPKILFILQPNYLDIKKGIIELCLEHQKSCAKILKDVRILPQVHKFMKLR
jgi:7-cyano-7-deazaguanosine (preQ0) biosynthesis protein QueE